MTLLWASYSSLESPVQLRRWAHDSVASLASAACKRAVDESGWTKLYKGCCPLVNTISSSILVKSAVPTVPLAWDALLVGSAPKAGTTQLRGIVKNLAPSYTNQLGQSVGEPNGNQSYSSQQAQVAAAAAPSNSTFSGLIVRDPLARFISGVREVVSTDCDGWLRWRQAPHGYHGAPSRGVGFQWTQNDLPHKTRAGFAGTEQANLAALRYGEKRTECHVETAAGQRLPWHSSTVWPHILRSFLADVADGFINPHTNPQHYHANSFPRRIDAVLRIENLDADWSLFVAAAGLRPLPLESMATSKHKSAKKPSIASGVSAPFSEPNEWLQFCRLYAADFVCLGYELPQACATQHDTLLMGDTAWCPLRSLHQKTDLRATDQWCFNIANETACSDSYVRSNSGYCRFCEWRPAEREGRKCVSLPALCECKGV